MLAEQGVRAEELAVTENEFGKPAFNPSLGLHFSISHSGERVMVAVSDRPVGCDVERIVPFDEAVARECLTDEELALARNLPSGSGRDMAFIRLWVRKEAYAKAVGRGFGIEPKTFAALTGDFPRGWGFSDFDYADGHLGCVAFPLQ